MELEQEEQFAAKNIQKSSNFLIHHKNKKYIQGSRGDQDGDPSHVLPNGCGECEQNVKENLCFNPKVAYPERLYDIKITRTREIKHPTFGHL
jgi:hypothetical protein